MMLVLLPSPIPLLTHALPCSRRRDRMYLILFDSHIRIPADFFGLVGWHSTLHHQNASVANNPVRISSSTDISYLQYSNAKFPVFAHALSAFISTDPSPSSIRQIRSSQKFPKSRSRSKFDRGGVVGIRMGRLPPRLSNHPRIGIFPFSIGWR